MPTPATATDPSRRTRSRLLACAYHLLAVPRHPLGEPLHVQATDAVHQVVIALTPLASPLPPRQPLPGKHFSDLKARIFQALAGGPLLGKQIAKAIGEKDTPSFRAILGNLVRRGAILPAPSGGYMQAPPCPTVQRQSAEEPS